MLWRRRWQLSGFGALTWSSGFLGTPAQANRLSRVTWCRALTALLASEATTSSTRHVPTIARQIGTVLTALGSFGRLSRRFVPGRRLHFSDSTGVTEASQIQNPSPTLAFWSLTVSGCFTRT
jgi:hypothetical protein